MPRSAKRSDSSNGRRRPAWRCGGAGAFRPIRQMGPRRLPADAIRDRRLPGPAQHARCPGHYVRSVTVSATSSASASADEGAAGCGSGDPPGRSSSATKTSRSARRGVLRPRREIPLTGLGCTCRWSPRRWLRGPAGRHLVRRRIKERPRGRDRRGRSISPVQTMIYCLGGIQAIGCQRWPWGQSRSLQSTCWWAPATRSCSEAKLAVVRPGRHRPPRGPHGDPGDRRRDCGRRACARPISSWDRLSTAPILRPSCSRRVRSSRVTRCPKWNGCSRSFPPPPSPGRLGKGTAPFAWRKATRTWRGSPITSPQSTCKS